MCNTSTSKYEIERFEPLQDEAGNMIDCVGLDPH